MKALSKPNLIIITGEIGSGKSTYARKYYPNALLFDSPSSEDINEIKEISKKVRKIVVCCLPEVVWSLIPDKDSGIAYQIITLKNFEVVQISGRGFNDVAAEVRKEIVKNIEQTSKEYKEPTLTEQLEKAKAEVKRLREAIQEQNKPKVGDWVKCKISQAFRKVKDSSIIGDNWKKITNPQLIKLLENESRN